MNIVSVFNSVNDMLLSVMPRLHRRALVKQMEHLKQKDPSLFSSFDQALEQEHLALWSRIGVKGSPLWYRMLSTISGISDARYVPEDIYQSVVERVLNAYSRRGVECEDKNNLDIYVNRKYTPKVHLRYIRGMFMDEDYRVMDEQEVNYILSMDHGDMIGKVCVGSLGGHDVCLFRFNGTQYVSDHGEKLSVDWLRQGAESYVLQEKVEQCRFSAQFNPSSANTFRMITLRCPWDGKVVLLKTGMRIGVTKEAIDNLSSGGMCVPVDANGQLGPKGYNWVMHGGYREYAEHPTSHVKFAGQCHPHFAAMKAAVIECATRIPYMNILGWDVLATEEGAIKFVEVNSTSIGTDWMQYGFGPLFGDLTEAVIAWAVVHRDFARFNYLKI